MKDLKDLVNNWNKAKADYLKLERDKTRLAGITGVKVVKQNFIKGGFDSGQGFEKWQERKPSTDLAYDRRYGVKGSNYSSKHKVLLQTRNLFNGVRYVVQNLNKVFIGVDLDPSKVPYAQFVNETRKYLGWSPKMKKAIMDEQEKRRQKIFEKFKK
jgi:hypothetical protein